MNGKNTFFWFCLFVFTLSGCASLNRSSSTQSKTLLSASGRAKIQQASGLTTLQRRYKAEQQATINAYRQLAALLFQQPLDAEVSVADKVLQDEKFRLYFDTFLREADIQRQNDPYVSQVVLHLSVTDHFRQCMSALKTVLHCLQEENKIAFSRIGLREATHKTVNLNCQTPDCSGQLSIAGFRRENHLLNKALLQAGLYDVEWLLNTSAQIAVRYLLLTEFPPTN